MEKNIDIQTSTEADSQVENNAEDGKDNQQYIEINMGVGVYDVNNPDFNEQDVSVNDSTKP